MAQEITQVLIGGEQFVAIISGNTHDKAWDGRETKIITATLTYADAADLFVDGAEWSIIYDGVDEKGQPVHEEYDNSDYCIAGDITDHRDGTISVKMGKPTDLEDLLEMLYGELSVGEVRE